MSIEGIGIIGATRKSFNIACILVEKGFQVRVYDSFKESLAVFMAKIKWRLERDGKSDFLSNIDVVQEYSKFRGADLILDFSGKTFEERFLYFSKFLKEVDSRCIIGINSVFPLITNFERINILPYERTVGVTVGELFPISVMEVSKTNYTELGVIETFLEFLNRLGIKGVVINDTPGGIIERLYRVYFNSAFDVLYKGKGFPSYIDESIKSLTNSGYGPFELLDLRSIDYDYNTSVVISEMIPHKNNLKPNEIEHKIFQYGQLGKKSSVGIYLYEDGQIVGENPVLPNIIQYLGLRQTSKEEIFSDVMIPLYNEAVEIAKELMVGEQDIESITKDIFGFEHGVFGYKQIYPELFVKKERSEFDNLDVF